jgi:hypothetical protein
MYLYDKHFYSKKIEGFLDKWPPLTFVINQLRNYLEVFPLP